MIFQKIIKNKLYDLNECFSSNQIYELAILNFTKKIKSDLKTFIVSIKKN